MNNNELSNENESKSIANDSSYIVLEDILYCSSPKRGIKSKSNLKNKNCIITPSNVNNHGNLFTFSVFREASTDICSKEEVVNSKKSSNIISDFSISYLKNLNNSNTENKKENMNIIIEDEARGKMKIKDTEEELEKDIKRKKNKQKEKHKSKKTINNYYFSNFEDNVKNCDTDKKSRNSRKKNTFMFDENKSKDKKIKRKNKIYASIDFLTQKKLKKYSKVNLQRYSSMNLMNDLNKKSKIKTHYYEDEYLDSNNKKKKEEEKNRLKDENKNIHHKRKKQKSKKEDKIKISMSSKNNDIIKNSDIFRTSKKKKKKDNFYSDNKDTNFEDNNFISHPIKTNKEKPQQESNMFILKSSRHISQKYLIKEIDRDYEALDRKNKGKNSDKKLCKKFKHKVKKSNKFLTEKEKQESLNASVATGIVLYEYVRQKISK